MLLAHELVIREFGGASGVLNINGLRAAIGRPYTGYYRTIERKAAALLESLSRNHGFVDGNKRTAVLMLVLLVVRSGYDFRFPKNENPNNEIESLVLKVVNREITFEETVKWLRAHLVRV